MSKEGVQNHLKNGGAHETTHEGLLILKNCPGSQENTSESSIWEELVVPTDTALIQDGGNSNVIVQEPSFVDFNFDAAHLALETTPAGDITEIMDGNFPASDSIGSAEWLKTEPARTTENTSTILENRTDGQSVKIASRELGDLFSLSSNDGIDMAFSLVEGLSLPSSHSVSHTRFATGNCHSSPVSPINFLEETPVGRSRSYSDTEHDAKAFLEELERGSQLTAEDKELMEMSRKELQAYEFQVFEQDKNNTLLTRHELENLPEQGLEFVEVHNLKVEKISEDASTEQETSPDSFTDIDSAEIVQSSMSFISTSSEVGQPVFTIPAEKFDPDSHTAGTRDASTVVGISQNQGPLKPSSKTDKSVMKLKTQQCVPKSNSVRNIIANTPKMLSTLNAAVTANQPQVAKSHSSKHVPKKSLNQISKQLSINALSKQKASANESPTPCIDESNLARVILTDDQGKDQVFQVDPANLIPVQMGSIVQPVRGGDTKAVGAESVKNIVIGVPGSNVHLAAVPMLYMKDGCLVIPVQQVTTMPDSAKNETEVAVKTKVEETSGQPQSTLANAPPQASTTTSRIISPTSDSKTSLVAGGSKSPVQMAKKPKPVGSGKQKTTEEGDKWLCNFCTARFSRVYKLKLHMMKHTGEKPFKCTFPECKWAFTTAFKLKRHFECHLGKKDYVCDYPGCGKQFTTVYNLNTHRKCHQRRCTMECPTCDEKFATQRQLDYHMRAKKHGQEELTYECPHEGCGRKFFSRYCMGSHMRVHLHSQKYPCPEPNCDRLFDKQCRLLQHMRSHTGEKPYKCTAVDCNAAFATQSKLKRHARKHTGERRWVCDIEGCGKAFLRSEHLRAHTITHTGEKPFECKIPDCNARFKCKSSLYVHLKRHTEEAKKREDPNYISKQNRSKYNSKAALNTRNNYNKQLQNALGDLFTLINAEDLESLINAQVEQQAIAISELPSASTQSVISAATPVNPAEILSVNLDGQQIVAQPLSSTFIAQQGVAGSLLAGTTNLTSTERLSQPALGSIINIAPVPSKPVTANRVTVKNKAPVREVVSGRGKKKKTTPADHTLVDLSLLKDVSGNMRVENTLATTTSLPPTLDSPYLETEDLTTTTVVNPNDIVTSRAITFRDPETGAIYVQTQLLQDDPPNPDLIYSDNVVCLDSQEPSSLGLDLPSMSLEGPVASTAAAAEYAGTTINLQDLE